MIIEISLDQLPEVATSDEGMNDPLEFLLAQEALQARLMLLAPEELEALGFTFTTH